jgi:FMN reductase
MSRVIAISAGLSDASSTTLLAHRVGEAITAHDPAGSFEIVTLRDLAQQVTEANIVGFAAPRLQAVLDQVGAADAVVFVTPTYQGSFSGLFKSFVDALDSDALIGKPVILAATGGTARHSLVVDYAMRPVFAYLQAFVVPTGVFASPHDWNSDGANALAARIGRAVDELMSVLGGASTGRSRDDSIDLFSEAMLSISDPQLPT